MSSRIVSGVVVAALLSFAAPAFAQNNGAAAEALFVEAKKLAAAGKFAEACPKFAESNRLDRGAGTMIHLADCYEKNKQTASAWATYREAASAAQALNRRDWEKLANGRANALEPKLAMLVVKVADPAPKIEVKRDDAVIEKPSWGIKLPIDTGAHTVTANAPGFQPFTVKITIAADGEQKVVDVPKLTADAPAVATTTPPPPTTTPDSQPPPKVVVDDGADTRRTVGYIVGGVGIAGIGVGAVTGFLAIGKNKDSKDLCPTEGACPSKDGVDANDSAKKLGTISTIGFIAGGVLLATGAVLVITSRSKYALVPNIGPQNAGLTVAGRF